MLQSQTQIHQTPGIVMKVSLHRFGLAAACAAALIAGCSPSGTPAATGAGEAKAGGDTAAFMGTWTLAGSIAAPWFTGPGFTPKANPEFAEKPLVLAADSASGPAVMTCDQPAYTTSLLPVQSLFEGNLTDIADDSRAIGVSADAKDIPTLMEGCKTGTADMEMSYHLIDPNTLLLGLDNVIYQFARQP
jgi:hypothetical protein